MAHYVKRLQAGRYCIATAYSRIGRKDCPQARAEKRNHSSKAQKVVNDNNSRVALTAIIAANFSDSQTAYFVTPSFDTGHYPDLDRQSAYWQFVCREADNYIARLRRLAKRRGSILKTVYTPGIGEDGRWHFHMLIDGATAEDLRDAWGRGDVDYHRLYSDTKWLSDRDWYSKAKNVNPVAIAKYMMSNASSCRKVGQHPWHVSRSCTRPKAKRAVLVSDAKPLEAPDGAEILDRETTATLYSFFAYIEYIEATPKPKRYRRRNIRGQHP